MRLNLPSYTQEEKREIFKSLKVDSKLYKIEYNIFYERTDCELVKVVRITPKGGVRLSNGELLKHLDWDYYLPTEEIERAVEYNKYKIILERLISNINNRRLNIDDDNLTVDDIKKAIVSLESLLNKEC